VCEESGDICDASFLWLAQLARYKQKDHGIEPLRHYNYERFGEAI